MASWVVTAGSPAAAAQAVAQAQAALHQAAHHAGWQPVPRPFTRFDFPHGPAPLSHVGMVPQTSWLFTPQELQALGPQITHQLRQQALLPYHQARVAGNEQAGQSGPCFTLMGLVLSGLGGLAVGMALGGLLGWMIANAMQVGTMVAPVAGAAIKGVATKFPLAAI